MRGPNYIRVNSISAEGQDSTCPKQFMAFVTVRGWVEEKAVLLLTENRSMKIFWDTDI